MFSYTFQDSLIRLVGLKGRINLALGEAQGIRRAPKECRALKGRSIASSIDLHMTWLAPSGLLLTWYAPTQAFSLGFARAALRAFQMWKLQAAVCDRRSALIERTYNLRRSVKIAAPDPLPL